MDKTENIFSPQSEVDVTRLTRDWLHKASRLVALPICLRAQMALKAEKLQVPELLPDRENSTRPDVCQFCGLKYDSTTTQYSLRRKRLKNRKHKNLLIQVRCKGCNYPAKSILMGRKKRNSNLNTTNVLSPDVSSIFTNKMVKSNIGSSKSSHFGDKRISTGSISKTPRSSNTRNNRNVNKLRRMITTSSPANASLNDFLKNISEHL